MSASEIAKGLTLWPADRPDYPMGATVHYQASDPYAIRLAFVQGSRETRSWTFGRELLAEGLSCRAGEGDVTVAPHEDVDDYLTLTFTPAPEDGGYPIALYAKREAVERLVDEVYGLVPVGREHRHIDVDAVIDRILAEVA
ncbi:SsgA family sporulation/cell division regulator [Nonomuraea sp. NPDC059194]|uniref:SsgA family sporulation/cell division regulator n=1 Tax=Nonomuraea sp. NPDC059194 TaxID=3346764 RepID=UPI0036A705C5